jgi:hypothetical protein
MKVGAVMPRIASQSLLQKPPSSAKVDADFA